jgi:hypothetical protein
LLGLSFAQWDCTSASPFLHPLRSIFTESPGGVMLDRQGEDLKIFNSVLSMLPTIRCHHCMARGGYGQANRVLYTCKLSVASGKFAFTLGTWEGH